MAYTNSSLVDCVVKSPNHSGTRTNKIDRITPHCVVGQLQAKTIGECFLNKSKKASCNYGIGSDGKVCLVVDESNRSWCSSSNANDQRAITIECASDTTHPYAFKPIVYQKLVELCVDICKRNNISNVLWIPDKAKSLAYNPKDGECVLTVHRWFENKECPGDWLYSRMSQLAKEINENLNHEEAKLDSQELKYAVGDVVDFTGSVHYVNASAKTCAPCSPGRATITAVYENSAHPYHVVAVTGGTSNVYGWVNASDVYCKVYDSIDKLANLGYINTPDYWFKNFREVKYLQQFLENAAAKLKEYKSSSHCVYDALDYLEFIGVINDVEYWQEHCRDIKYLESLIVRLGNVRNV